MKFLHGLDNDHYYSKCLFSFLLPHIYISHFVFMLWSLEIYLTADSVLICHYFSNFSNGKEYAYNAGDPTSIAGSLKSSGKGNGYPLQYSCLENSMDRRAWQATVRGVAKSQTRLSDWWVSGGKPPPHLFYGRKRTFTHKNKVWKFL